MNFQTSTEIEYAVSYYFSPRRYVIVPNVSWGMFSYELDLCLLNHKSRFAVEVEIKVSKADLLRDGKKEHNHDRNHNLIKYLYFAMPERMRNCIDLVPERAGILFVTTEGQVLLERRAKPNPVAKTWTDAEAYELARLGTMRVWPLKRKLFMRMQAETKKVRILRIRGIVRELEAARRDVNQYRNRAFMAEEKNRELELKLAYLKGGE